MDNSLKDQQTPSAESQSSSDLPKKPSFAEIEEATRFMSEAEKLDYLAQFGVSPDRHLGDGPRDPKNLTEAEFKSMVSRANYIPPGYPDPPIKRTGRANYLKPDIEELFAQKDEKGNPRYSDKAIATTLDITVEEVTSQRTAWEEAKTDGASAQTASPFRQEDSGTGKRRKKKSTPEK